MLNEEKILDIERNSASVHRPFMKTVLGDIRGSDVGFTLVHEHICCYS